MILSHLGIIVDLLLHDIPNHWKHVLLGEYIILPNHLHGILIIDKPDDIGNISAISVETRHALSLPQSQ